MCDVWQQVVYATMYPTERLSMELFNTAKVQVFAEFHTSFKHGSYDLFFENKLSSMRYLLAI
jgi:hypothetical protein